jgi:hypothetical protein
MQEQTRQTDVKKPTLQETVATLPTQVAQKAGDDAQNNKASNPTQTTTAFCKAISTTGVSPAMSGPEVRLRA